MAEKNMLEVVLYDLGVTGQQDDYYGKVRSKGKVNNLTIAQRIKKEGTEYQLETLVEILNRADRIKAEGLAAGYNINTLFVNASVGISGVFYDTAFDPKQHQLKARVTPSQLTRSLLEETGVNIQGQAQTGMVIMSVLNHLTSAVNSTITPGNVIVIKGDRLKIEADDANEDKAGVFFTNTATDERIKSSQILSNKEKELIVMVPALTSGDYQLEIVTQATRGTMLKNLRSELFDKVLTVDEAN
jgi:hypothetical protein